MSMPTGFAGCFGSRAGSTAQLIGSVHKSRAIEVAPQRPGIFQPLAARETFSDAEK
jgi:hypothetical protein